MITLERKAAMSFFKFLRLVRFSAMFNPFKRVIGAIMRCFGKSSFQINDVFDLIVIFMAVVMIAHMSACVWIYLGHIEDYLPEEERHTWRFNQDFGSDFAGYNDY